MVSRDKAEDYERPDLPAYLRRWPGLYVRAGHEIIEASAEESAVARQYPLWPDKGPLLGGKRITLMTNKTSYQVKEKIRVIHVVEVAEPGYKVYIMGPKPVTGEYLDGKLATKEPPTDEDPLEPLDYDGPTLPSPAVDYNYDITTYSFSEPGTHEISWRLGLLQSNTLTISVTQQAKR